jgi:ABC-type phosphate transport system auxiliary subunit
VRFPGHGRVLLIAPGAERMLTMSLDSCPGAPMVVTAKLSRKFYERFGDDLTNELVNWMNQVDETYRTEFRDLFEAHFGRFNALLEQRVAQLDAKLEQRTAQLDAKLDQRTAQIEAKFEQHTALIDAKLERMKTELLRWTFLFWIGTLGTVVALMKL